MKKNIFNNPVQQVAGRDILKSEIAVTKSTDESVPGAPESSTLPPQTFNIYGAQMMIVNIQGPVTIKQEGDESRLIRVPDEPLTR